MTRTVFSCSQGISGHIYLRGTLRSAVERRFPNPVPLPAQRSPPALLRQARDPRRCTFCNLCVDVRRRELGPRIGGLRVRVGPKPQGLDAQARRLFAGLGRVRFSSVLAHALCPAARRVNEGKWDVRQMVTSGGMPSSHSALVRSAARVGEKSLTPLLAGVGPNHGRRAGRRLW